MIILQKPKDWMSVTKEIQKPEEFIKQLEDLDKQNIPDSVLEEIGLYIRESKPDIEEIKGKSMTAYLLWIWVHAIENYHNVYKSVKP